ncbi:ATP-binding cassette domain-containing protein [bacterium]|nr:ATP-binding cassette domain-containing protein [bacterium]
MTRQASSHPSAAIEVKGLTNRFGKHVVHDKLDFRAEKGSITGIVGGSGSGKSVLMRSIIGLQKFSSGTVLVNGRPMKALNMREAQELRRSWGVMYQSGALFSALTVVENIAVPMHEYLHLPDLVIRELAMLKLRMVGLPDNAADKFPAELSGGMVKRAALARALALDPALLFLDEPTAGLDPIAAQDFDQLLLELRRQLGLTVMMITHDLDSLFTICDQVAVLVDKKMVQSGVKDIVKHPNPWIQEYFGGQRAARFVRKAG